MYEENKKRVESVFLPCQSRPILALNSNKISFIDDDFDSFHLTLSTDCIKQFNHIIYSLTHNYKMTFSITNAIIITNVITLACTNLCLSVA